MIRKIIALWIALLALGLLSVLIVFGVLHTQYAKPIITYALQQTLNIKVDSEAISYHYPNRIDFSNANFSKAEHDSISVNKLSVWFSLPTSTSKWLHINELYVSGANLSNLTLGLDALADYQINNIALDHVDYSGHNVIINDLQLQLRNLEVRTSIESTRADFQVRASQLYYQGEAINELLLDGSLAGDNTKIYGASFTWKEALVTTQAQIENGHWSLVNTTINKLKFDLSELSQGPLSTLTSVIGHINSLDLLNSDITYQGAHAENVSASLENIDLTRSIWTQSQAYLSLDADKLQWQQFDFIEPTLELSFSPNKLDIKDLDTNLEQGRIQIAGTLTPNSIALDKVDLDGIKYYQEQQNHSLTDLFTHLHLSDLKQLSIDSLNINRSQWIQLARKPYWQVTGLNLQAEDLLIKKDYRWGFWQGSAIASANSASIDKTIANQVAVETKSTDGKWQLNRLFIPYDSGYISASAELDFAAPSQPLRIDAEAYSAPVELLNYLTDSKQIQISGLADVALSVNALTADKLSLQHTLSGSLEANFYNTQMTTEETDTNNVSLSPFKLNADRGQLTLAAFEVSSQEWNGKAENTIDLRKDPLRSLQLTLHSECDSQYHVELLTGHIELEEVECAVQKKQQVQP
ncbi:AsmA family protein [Vibrio mediterranei]|uniref:AsmA family protein n=3 Tax=Vibrio TaxID=662 RepID=A0ABX5DBK2_9VIBR|nr:AsmA family protein [Vibrio mediterranei]MCG9660292.1 AsmA family protein [Vibrio mediterranei]MCG9665409.1 AsmA family protein [Vibrio mediterranei]PCD86622.1 AsmA family protein [Vibrio mediterranei]PRQ65971.1 AsmA family protein [Vibrio mediterranei]PTC02640.1 AsmA family protein [Vibrio mediterranei]